MDFGEEVTEYLNMKGKSTRATYAGSFRLFLRYYHNKYGETKGIADFLDRVFAEFQKPPGKQRRIAETELKGYIDFLKNGENFKDKKARANNTVRVYFTAIQDFLKFKQITVSSRFMGNLPASVEQKKNHKHEWIIEQIRQFVDSAPTYRDKAIIVCMFQSGLGVNELCLLNYGDIEQELNKGTLPLFLNLTRQKTSVEFKTFLGADSANYLKLYLATRKNLTSGSPLFEKDRYRNGDSRITVAAIEQRFSEIAEGLDFIKKNEGYNAARPHSLRAAFISQLTNKVSDKLIEFWAGHSIGAEARAYLNMPTEELRVLYMDSEKYLAIEKTSRDELTEKVKEVKLPPEIEKEIADLKTTVSVLSKELQEEKTVRENTEKAFGKTVDKLIDRIKNLEQKLSAERDDNKELNAKNALFEKSQ